MEYVLKLHCTRASVFTQPQPLNRFIVSRISLSMRVQSDEERGQLLSLGEGAEGINSVAVECGSLRNLVSADLGPLRRPAAARAARAMLWWTHDCTRKGSPLTPGEDDPSCAPRALVI